MPSNEFLRANRSNGGPLVPPKRSNAHNNAHRAFRTVGPAVDVVTLAEAKAFMNVTFADDDSLIQSQIDVATKWLEDKTRRAFINQTWTLTFDEELLQDWFELPRPSLQDVTKIETFIDDGTGATFDLTKIVISKNRMVGRVTLINGNTWPTDLRNVEAFVVTFIAGYGALATDVPEPLHEAILRFVDELYQHRCDVAVGTIVSSLVPFNTLTIASLYTVPKL